MATQTAIKTEAQVVNDMAAEYAAIQNKVQADLDRMAEIEETFRDMGADTYHTESGTVKVTEYHRFNANDAIDQMSERSLQRVLVEKVDAKKVKDLFPGIYRRAQRQYQNRFSFEAN